LPNNDWQTDASSNIGSLASSFPDCQSKVNWQKAGWQVSEVNKTDVREDNKIYSNKPTVTTVDFVDDLNNRNSIETQSTIMISTKQKFAEKLDNLSYRILGIGFPLLTIGILSGAVWANEAWGSYWSWDPKETWALATWFVFAIYLHSGKKPAIIASLGFVTVWICFLGVNLLGEGLHSYGFFK
jgi:cytochrome c-type biogenesis protein CcsB